MTLTKDMILDVAEQVFRRFGPSKTSVVDVARALNLSHGNLYRFFSSKTALREAVTERWSQQILVPLNDILEQPFDSSITRLRTWLETLIYIKHEKANEDPELFRLYAAVTEERGASVERHFNELVRQIKVIVESGIDSKEFLAGDPTQIATGILIATSRFHHPAHFRDWKSSFMKDQVDNVCNIVLRGIVNPD
ncbi:TetR/AcrR family transcriptional regulator [Paenibacillus sp. P26]|nr:TetR/AcrR family transcriptional regulator [Paenibacillus sp. P26]UUZ93583.1 TetR/AcrR family transcriptional regulator [Paenibacillus sp. P25]